MKKQIELLRKIAIFADLADDDLGKLIELSEKRKYPRNSIILYRGDEGRAVYLIRKGKVKITLNNEDGKEIILNTLTKGNYFGEMSIFDKRKRSANVVAMLDSEFLVISNNALNDLIKKRPEISFKLLSEMSLRLRAADEQIRSLTFNNVRHRVAQVLKNLFKEHRLKNYEGYQVISRPAIKDIAALAGTTRETASRILNEFSRQGILKLTKEHIIMSEQDIKDSSDNQGAI